jgi:iron(III) transport system permease protein
MSTQVTPLDRAAAGAIVPPRSNRWLSRLRPDYVIQGGAGWLMCLLVLGPLAVIMFKSGMVEEWGKPARYTLQNYVTTFANARLFGAILNTVIASIGTTAFAGVVGVTLAWLVARTDVPGRRWLDIGNTVPIYLSPFIGAIAWTYLAAPRTGFLNSMLGAALGLANDTFNIYGLHGIVWVQAIFFTPLVYVMTLAALRHMDPSLEECSRACGRGILATTFRVTLPLVTPSILSALILTFVSSAGEFGVPLTLGSPKNVDTLSTRIFESLTRSRPDYNLAAAMGTILMVATVACVLLHRYVILRRNYITVAGRGYRPALIRLGRWRWAGLAFNLLYLVVAVFLPLLMLVLMSLQKAWLGSFSMARFTFSNYVDLFDVVPAAIVGLQNSLILSVVGATIGVLVSLLIAQAIYRSKLPGRHLIDMITSLPVGIPGIVLAMGILIIVIRTPLYGSLLVLLVAYLTRFIPAGQRSVSGVLLATSPELEEASRACGSGYARTLWRVTLPLVKPGLVAAWILLFIFFLRELPISILLFQPGNEVMSVALWILMEHTTAGRTAAYALMQCALVLVFVAGVRMLTERTDAHVVGA